MVYTTPNGFLNYDSEIAVPTGAMTLDEATLPTKSRNRAVSYMPSKPHKYGVSYYMIVGSKYQYIFTMYDNGRGNKTTVPIVQRYCDQFSDVRTTLMNECISDDTVPIDSATALWIAQVILTTKKNSL